MRSGDVLPGFAVDYGVDCVGRNIVCGGKYGKGYAVRGKCPDASDVFLCESGAWVTLSARPPFGMQGRPVSVATRKPIWTQARSIAISVSCSPLRAPVGMVVSMGSLPQVPTSVSADSVDLVEPDVVVADACRVIAGVTGEHAGGQRTTKCLLKSVSVRSDAAASELSVAIPVGCSAHQPATVIRQLLDPRPELIVTGKACAQQRVAALYPSLVVHGAPAASYRGPVASVDATGGPRAFDTLCHVGPPSRSGRGRDRLRGTRPTNYSRWHFALLVLGFLVARGGIGL